MPGLKFYILLLLSLSSLAFAQAESNLLDSLELKLHSAKNPAEKANILMEISEYWSYRDTAMAFRKIKEAEKLVKSDIQKGKLEFYKAGIYYDYNIEKSRSLYMKAENLIKKIDSKEAYELRARLWHNYGALAQVTGSDKEFLDITLSKCIPLAEKAANKKLLSGYLTDVGIVFFNQKEYGKSMTYYQKALKILESLPKKTDYIIWLKANMLDVYTETQQIANGRKIIGEMEKVISEYPESTFNSFYYYSASKFYNSVEYEASALQSIEKGLAFAAKLNQNYDYLTLSFEKYRILKANKRFGEAKSVILPLLNDKKYSGKKKNRLMFLKEISEIEENLGNYKQANL